MFGRGGRLSPCEIHCDVDIGATIQELSHPGKWEDPVFRRQGREYLRVDPGVFGGLGYSEGQLCHLELDSVSRARVASEEID